MEELTGQTFAGYEILAKLGEGGFGAVYKARQPRLNRLVALKILAPHLAADADFVARFKREATLAASFNHPNLVLVFAAGESDGSQYMAMEFVEGKTLGQHIEYHGRLEPREALAIAVYVAQALQYAWNKSRLIHRDIKPDNVFVSVAGEIKVGDLGLAKSVGQSTTGMTATGMMMGSPHYISPEQASAKKDIDFRADIYSLGCTLYQMLTGKTPYEGNDPMVVMGLHVNAPPPAMFKVWPQCPMPLALLVGKMLKKNPRERHASYEELIAELTAVHEKLTAAQAASAAPPSGTITFLFTDIEGSTQLWEKHPQAMPIALERHNQILRRTMESHGGFVFKTVGDAFCVAFASAPNAMGAALAAQRALAAEPWGATGPLRVRMALHTGAAEERGGDYFGPTLNRVARVLAAGHGGQILLSQATEQLVRDHLTEGVSLGDLGERSLKNLTRTERIFQINLPDLPTEFPTLRAAAATPVPKPAQQARRSPVMIYGAVGAAVIALVAGLLLWSPWKERGASSVEHGVPSASPQRSNTPTIQPSAVSASATLPQLGNVFTNAVGAEMVYIPPGEFLLGSTKEEQAWAISEGREEKGVEREGEVLRKAKIKQGFWMSRTEVTVGQWKQFVKETAYVTNGEKQGESYVTGTGGKPWVPKKGVNWRNPDFGFELRDDYPVSCISWNDALAFCEWLTEQERKAGKLPAGMVVRLPTEAEWEYACRAGTQTKFWWGDSKEDGKGRLNWKGKDDGFEFVAPVDSFGERGRNRFGLADMLGNVSEWCLDEDDVKQAHEELWTGNSRARVVRGGSYYHVPAECRAACRPGASPSSSGNRTGFRVVFGVDVSGAKAPAASTSPTVASPETAILAPTETRVSALTTNPKVGEVCTLALGGSATLELVYIPSGEFIMGSTKEEQARAVAKGMSVDFVRRDGEGAVTATIRQGFWMGRTEVTVGQWKEFVTATGYKTDAEKKGYAELAWGRQKQTWEQDLKGANWRDPGFDQEDNHPVCCVSWNDAMTFCEWLTERERKAGRLSASHVVRLPTEAEWEYACRAGTHADFWWGEAKEDGNGRFNSGTKSDGFEFTSPVDSYGERGRNKFGLAGMLGNVQEWCLDGYDRNQAHEECYKGNPKKRVMRGGSFRSSVGNARCAKRSGIDLATSNCDHGFRVVMDADQSGTTAAAAPTSRSTDDAFTREVAALPAEQQVARVAAKLKELNPGFDGEITPTIEGGKVVGLAFATKDVLDISPVRVLSDLAKLVCTRDGSADVMGRMGKLKDLSPIQGMKLKDLNCRGNPISDLSPLKGMPLTRLDCGWTKVADLSALANMPLGSLALVCCPVSDLSPLKGMPLWSLSFNNTKVTDLSSLTGMRLTSLFCLKCPIADLSPLKGMRLTRLACQKTQVTDWSVLKGMPLKELAGGFKLDRDTGILRSIKTLEMINGLPATEFWKQVEAGKMPGSVSSSDETSGVMDAAPVGSAFTREVAALPAEQQAARVAAKLKELNPGFDGKVTPTIEGGKVVGLEFSTEFVADISPVRALSDLRSLVCKGSGETTDRWPGVSGELTDLSPLQGLKLDSLRIQANHISDLTPLAGMPLTNLVCVATDVVDLRSLAGAPLKSLTCSKAKVSDLSPLKGAPLEILVLNDNPVSNLSPLAGLPLKTLAIHNCKQITDLSPLKDMQLKVLRCYYTSVSDLSSLKGMQLTVLICMGTKVKDLSPLRGMPVGDLRISDTLVEDLSPLQDIPVVGLQCNFKPERDTAILRSIKTLKTINKVPVAEFWKQVEAGNIPPPPIIIQKADEKRLLDLGGGVTLELVAIPAGEFMMGSTKEEQAWAMADGAKEDEAMKREGEAPRMTRIKDGFWLGRTEVTAGQWKQFVKETSHVTDGEKKDGASAPQGGTSWRDPGFGSPPQDNHPVCCVSWNDAMAFCKWLTERERKAGRLSAEQVIRLPTEAEWEYACRAGTQTKFWWGESKEDGKDRLNWKGKDDGFEWLAPVDSFGARGRNGFGLADMLGNVREWCLDEYDAKQAHEECYRGYSGARVLRGGSWTTPPAQTRCAACNNLGPARWHTHVGFRVALGLPR